MRVYNFSAGPSMMPLAVLEEAQKDFIDYKGSGMSVTEFSHRSKWYEEIHFGFMSLLRELMNIPDEYEIVLMGGGASTQFEAVPLNLLGEKAQADYIVSGNFSKKAYKFAERYGDIKLVYSAEENNYTDLPDFKKSDFRNDSVYLHITGNNTIFGLAYDKVPECDIPVVADLSSGILGKKYDVKEYGLIYAGAQKNIAPAGVTVVIVRKDMLKPMAACPKMLNYSTHIDGDNLFNTPPVFPIYMGYLNLKYMKAQGGVDAFEKINNEKAGMLYDFIDNSALYKNNVNPRYRSIMNVPFVTPSKELDAKFITEAAQNGLVNIKGHKLVGGMRASIYNGMPIEGVKALISFMKKFETENKQA